MCLVRHVLAALAALLLLPVGLVVLLLRPRLFTGLGERLGARPAQAPGGVWVHAAALGELRAASPLIERLRASGRRVCTSASNLDGREVMRRRQPQLPCHLAPLDHPWCVALALARAAPAALVLVETELWPCWIAAARRRGVPVVLVSGRLSDRSFPRYRRVRAWLAPTFARLVAVGARSECDAERFRALGTPAERVSVIGDLKLDCAEPLPLPPPDLAERLAASAYWVAGSTHSGEESLLLDAFDRLEDDGLASALVLAPRHPSRAGEVRRLVRRRGRRARLRSRLEGPPLGPGEVLVLDTLGELASLYRGARVVFVGGSLVPIGGHDVLEPARAGRPVLFGPHIANTRESAEILVGVGAGREVHDARSLGDALCALLEAPERADALGESGRMALLAHHGSAARAQQLVEAVLDAAPAA
ncbi:MAG: 3-deoxy-D-manno-octulosonic acid transferase [Deltaproteobacteria bacterium]|nr:3-deoxy-D-manno-octulosonic acid transferase [Deltaproteobacteria bacterium]